MHIAATVVLCLAAAYCACRAVHWYEVAPVRPRWQHPYARALGWGLGCISCVGLLHPVWQWLGGGAA